MLRSYTRFLKSGECLWHLHRMKLHTNTAKVLYSSFDKDLPNPNLPTPLNKAYSHDTDILLEQLKHAKTVTNLLDISSSHLEVMNAQHVVSCLRSIHSLTNKVKGLKPNYLLEDQTFQAMCSRLMKIVRLLDAEDLITVYKVLSAIGVRNNAFVMQSVLKMLAGHLNNMDLGQLTFLNFLLSKQRHNALVDALKLAIPLVLQVHIEQQLDSDNINQVVDCLQLACKSNLRPSTIQKIVGVLLEKAKMLSHNHAITVIVSLMNTDTPVDGFKELINYSLETITRNLESMQPQDILFILRFCRGREYYHSPFCFALAKKIVSNNWNLTDTWEAIRYLKKIVFCPPNLIDHFAKVLYSEARNFKSNPSYSVLNCVEYLSASGYHPPNVMEVLAMLCTCEEKIQALNELSPSLLVKFVSCLTTMGYFPQDLLSQILDEDFLFMAWSKSRKHGRSQDLERNLLSLVCSFDVYDQQDNYALPASVLNRLIQTTHEKFANLQCQLEKFIQNGLGGTQFLQSNVFTQDGIFIDHVLGMRSGNYPVSLQQPDLSSKLKPTSITLVEDIILPTDAKIVTVIVAKEEHYCLDPEVLTGWMDLKIRCLSKRKFSPVVINFQTWTKLPDREKIPYLMREIKQAVQEEPRDKTISSL